LQPILPKLKLPSYQYDRGHLTKHKRQDFGAIIYKFIHFFYKYI